MAWQGEMGTLVRHLVDDLSDSPTYSDDRVEQSIAVAAQLLINEVDFDETYTVSLDCPTISPDPTTLATKDDTFINLVAMRAACVILSSELKTRSLDAVKVTDGPSTIDMTSSLKGIQKLYEDACQRYEDAKFQFQAGGSIGKAVLTPFSPASDYVGRRQEYYWR